MTKILLVRHGQSLSNINNVFTGSTDISLSDLGITQAKKMAEYVTKHYKIDKIYSSDLSRAVNTAKPVSEIINKKIEVSSELREIYAGKWEGMLFTNIAIEYPDEYKLWIKDIGKCQCPGGENANLLAKRIFAKLRDIADCNPDCTVLVATHAMPIRTVETVIKTGSVENMKNFSWVSNASVTEIDYDNDKFKICSIGYDDYLTGIKTELPKEI